MAENFNDLAAEALADPVRRARIDALRQEIERWARATPVYISTARLCVMDVSTGVNVHEPGRATSAPVVSFRLVPSRSAQVA